MALGSIGSAVGGIGQASGRAVQQAPDWGRESLAEQAPQTTPQGQGIWDTVRDWQTNAPRPPSPGSQFIGNRVAGIGQAAQQQQGAIGYQMGLAAPRQAALNLSDQIARRSFGFDQQGYNLQRGNLAGDHASDVARLGLKQQGLGLDRENLNTRRAGLGIDRQGIGIDRNYIGNMRGLGQRAYDTTIEGINRDQRTELRNIGSDYTSRGAWFAPFQTLDRQDAIGQADQARTEAGYDLEGKNYGWDRDLGRLGLDDQRIDLSYRDLATAEQSLDLQAQQLGLDRADLDRALQYGMAQLGLDEAQGYQGLLDLLASNSVEGMQMFNDIMAAAAASGYWFPPGFNQNVAAGPSPNMGGGWIGNRIAQGG